eukprot:gene39591-48915_t
MSKITKVLVTGKTRTTGTDAAIFSGKHDGKLEKIAASVPEKIAASVPV